MLIRLHRHKFPVAADVLRRNSFFPPADTPSNHFRKSLQRHNRGNAIYCNTLTMIMFEANSIVLCLKSNIPRARSMESKYKMFPRLPLDIASINFKQIALHWLMLLPRAPVFGLHNQTNSQRTCFFQGKLALIGPTTVHGNMSNCRQLAVSCGAGGPECSFNP